MSNIYEQQSTILEYKHPDIFSEIDGVVHFPGTTREILQTYPKLETRDTDVIIATWPKSGTTWAMEIVWQIFNDAQVSQRRVDQRVPFLEVLCWPDPSGNLRSPEDVRKAFDNLPSPRLIKTHLHYANIPKGDSDKNRPKIILVVRNPKDCAVSYWHHYTGFAVLQCECSWDEYFEHFMNGNLIGGCWFEFMREWWKHRHDPNILLIKYEDMKMDALGAIKRIASFVNKPLSEKVMEQIAEQTTFKSMQNNPAFDHSWFGVKPNAKCQFMRKGEVGDWTNYFTDEQNKRFQERFDKEMYGTGLTMDLFK